MNNLEKEVRQIAGITEEPTPTSISDEIKDSFKYWAMCLFGEKTELAEYLPKQEAKDKKRLEQIGAEMIRVYPNSIIALATGQVKELPYNVKRRITPLHREFCALKSRSYEVNPTFIGVIRGYLHR